ncbi:MAG: NDP-sugar synthase [Bradymonadaceae bacterium]
MSGDEPTGAVLCAGFGTRMRPLTEAVPKPLLPFLNTPILTYALDHLADAGIRRVGMNLHHLADSVPPVANRLCRQFGLEAAYSREWEILGTAGGIRGIWHALGEPDSTLVVTNGDSVMNIDLEEHLEAHRESGAGVTLVVRPKADEQPGKIWVDEAGRLRGIRDFRAPESGEDASLKEFDFTGLHLLEPQVLSDIPMENGCVIEDVYGPMLEDGAHINVSVHDEFWAALDNPGLLLSTSKRVLDQPDQFEQAPLEGEEGDGLFVAEPEALPEEVELVAPVFVGPNVDFEPGTRIGPNAVVDGVELSGGNAIEEAIVYGVGDVDRDFAKCVAVAGQIAELD